jgi:release factor glutamine methyltransferase
MNIAQTLRHAIALGVDRLDAQLLLLHTLGRAEHDRAWLLAHDTDEVAPEAQHSVQKSVLRRLAGEPVAYITGRKEFYGLALAVDARVLVPRPDTETLVDWVLEQLAPAATSTGPVDALGASHGPTRTQRVIDLGTGSGAIALALKHARPDVDVHAVDTSTDALAVTRANAQRLQLDVHFSQGSWLSGLSPATDPFDVIASNPPYIAALDEHLAALIHEPLQALASGTDGLDDIREIIAQAPSRLSPHGWLLLEHGYDQAEQVRSLLSAAGFAKVQSRNDLVGIERCSGGQWC